jgi:hypothetical protein
MAIVAVDVHHRAALPRGASATRRNFRGAAQPMAPGGE